MSSILRLCESSGSIRIDGLDVSEIGLQDLRNKVSIIPMVCLSVCLTSRMFLPFLLL